MDAEGWYADPFEAHEARWFSDGAPTALVRDGAVEGRDDPPQAGWGGELTPTMGDVGAGGDDLRRVDDADQLAVLNGVADKITNSGVLR